MALQFSTLAYGSVLSYLALFLFCEARCENKAANKGISESVALDKQLSYFCECGLLVDRGLTNFSPFVGSQEAWIVNHLLKNSRFCQYLEVSVQQKKELLTNTNNSDYFSGIRTISAAYGKTRMPMLL